MSRVEYDFSDFRRLNDNITKLGSKAEDGLNTSLKKHAERILTSRITPLIPISRRKGRVRDKVHARHTKWFKSEYSNLEATVKSKGGAAKNKGSFGYLVFPDEGRGKYNPRQQDFTNDGKKVATPELIDQLQKDLMNLIEEEL